MPDMNPDMVGSRKPMRREDAALPLRRRPGIAAMTRPPVVLAAFTATTFLSALLLFSMQPMFAKMVLPVLGGSPQPDGSPMGRASIASTHTPRWTSPVCSTVACAARTWA